MTRTPEDARKVMISLQGIYATDVIRGWETKPLVLIDNTGMKEIVGFSVIVHVSPDFEYENWVINIWKKELGADSWSVRTKKNSLQFKFNTYYGRTRSTKGNQ